MDEEYVEAVLALVEGVPPGRVTTYGTPATCHDGTALDRLRRDGVPVREGRLSADQGWKTTFTMPSSFFWKCS